MLPSTRDVDIKSLNQLMHFIQSIYLYKKKKIQRSTLNKTKKEIETQRIMVGIFNSLIRKYARSQV